MRSCLSWDKKLVCLFGDHAVSNCLFGGLLHPVLRIKQGPFFSMLALIMHGHSKSQLYFRLKKYRAYQIGISRLFAKHSTRPSSSKHTPRRNSSSCTPPQNLHEGLLSTSRARGPRYIKVDMLVQDDKCSSGSALCSSAVSWTYGLLGDGGVLQGNGLHGLLLLGLLSGRHFVYCFGDLRRLSVYRYELTWLDVK